MTVTDRHKRFKAGFSSRLFLIFTFFTGIISIIFVFIFITGEINSYKERTTEKAHLLASLLAGRATLPLFSENIPELERLAREILATPAVTRITITNHENRRLLDIASPDFTSKQPVIESSVQVLTTSSTPSAETALLGGTFRPTGSAAPLGSVVVAIDTSDRGEAIRSALFKTAGIAFFFWLAVIAACYPILQRVTRSFNTLIGGLDTMMGGNFSTKIIIDSDDEAGRAAQAINRLAAALEERDAENRNLQAELVNAMKLEVQQERKQIMAKLIQTNRMTSLGLLISSIAHNINTPNGAIKLAAQHVAASWKDALPILEQVTEEEGDFTLGGLPFGVAKIEIKGATESILNNANRVQRVIHDLRTYNVGERSELSPGVSVNQAVEEALTIIRAHGRQGEISITPTFATNLPLITGNQYQLEQVFVNLLLNALQSMTVGKGAVTIQTEFSPETSEVRITVTDQGEGIAPENREQLFEAFFSTKIERGGSGLGLYISNFIIGEHKGRITIEPHHLCGTIATVHLPVTL